jgi:hypothetical protein
LTERGGRLFYHPGIRIFHAVTEERAEPSFFYKRYYWGGITDYVMARTLRGIRFQHIDQSGEPGSRARRLITNFYHALGLFESSDKVIQSRIYLSYVIGRIVAMLKYGWKRVEH